jgi:hypothetical protein
MSGLFSPNIRVPNEPLYLRSKIRTMTRCLSACLSTVTIFAAIKVIWWPLSTSEFDEFGIYLQRLGWMNFASFYHLLPYFIRQAVLASRYSKGWFNQITDLATFEPSDLQSDRHRWALRIYFQSRSRGERRGRGGRNIQSRWHRISQSPTRCRSIGAPDL